MAAITASALPQSHDKRANACNNSPTLCERHYNEVTYLGAHNSYALRDESTDGSLFGNQYLNATLALDAGLRLLQTQTHEGNSTLELCHSSCDMLDAGPLENWLTKINAWMDENPNEVVTVIVVNSDSAPPSEFNRVLQSSGIANKAYQSTTGAPSGSWPTLQKMIDDNQRFVLFVTNIDYSADAPSVLPEFDFVFETAYEVTEISGFNCTVDRPSKITDGATAVSSNYLSLANHFKYQQVMGDIQLPDVETIETVNSASTEEQGNLGLHLQQCNQEWNSVPNFVLVDFWNEGEPLAAVDTMNKIKDATGRTEAKSGDDDTSAAGRVGAGRMGYGVLAAFALPAAMLLV